MHPLHMWLQTWRNQGAHRTLRWEVAALPLLAVLLWAVFGPGPSSVAIATVFALAVVLWLLAGVYPTPAADR